MFASDEWYINADYPIPDEEYYEGYGQIENGVGMVRSLLDEVDDEMKHREGTMVCKQVSIATGKLAGPILKECAEKITEKYPNISIQVHVIRNDFFGEDITVAGLITGQDLINQ